MRKKENKRPISLFLMILMLCTVIGSMSEQQTYAKAAKVGQKSEQTKAAEVNAGPGVRDVLLARGQKVKEKHYNRDCFTIGDHGLLGFISVDPDDATKNMAPPKRKEKSRKDPFKNFKITYKNSNPEVIKINKKKHTYTAVTGGSATVTFTMRYCLAEDIKNSEEAASGSAASGGATSGGSAVVVYKAKATYTFIVGDDTSRVKLAKKEATIYKLNDLEDWTTTIDLKKCPEMTYYNMDVTSSNSEMDVVVGMSDPCGKSLNVLVRTVGKTTITVTLNNTVLTFKLKVVDTPINISSRVLDKGKSIRLKLKHYPEAPEWISTDPKVASVDKNGKVKAKKIGNAIIYADIDGHRTGCVVSVVKKGITKVVKRARFIGTHWEYSQPKRMKKKYYDCSSLVWKAYRKMGKYICGAYGYAPVAADIGHWLVRTKRSLGYFKESKIDKLFYLPGDVLLKVHMRSDRYRGIGHIEMITGYSLHGFIDKKPVLYLTWGAREEGYTADHVDDFVGRPYN